MLVGDPDQLSLGRRRRRADRPGPRLRGPRRLPGRRPAHDAPLRRRDPGAGRGAARSATPTRRSRCWPPGTTPSSGSPTPTRPPRSARPRCPPRWPSATPPWPATPARALAALDRHRLLCAHRDGPYGVRHWNRRIEQWLTAETGDAALRRAPTSAVRCWSRPTTTRSASTTATPASWSRCPTRTAGRHRATGRGPLDLAPSRLGDVETMHAMTIHKSQGSQADEVTVLLPDEDSRLLTRELFYTAVTRAQQQVRVIGPEPAVRAAVATAGPAGERPACCASRTADTRRPVPARHGQHVATRAASLEHAVPAACRAARRPRIAGSRRERDR